MLNSLFCIMSEWCSQDTTFFVLFPIWGRQINFFILRVLGPCASISTPLSSMSSYNFAPPQSRSSYISVSTHFHLLRTTSPSIFLSTCPHHLSLASFISSLCQTFPCSYVFCPDLLNPLYSYNPSHNCHLCPFQQVFFQFFSVPRWAISHFHTLAQVWWRSYILPLSTQRTYSCHRSDDGLICCHFQHNGHTLVTGLMTVLYAATFNPTGILLSQVWWRSYMLPLSAQRAYSCRVYAIPDWSLSLDYLNFSTCFI